MLTNKCKKLYSYEIFCSHLKKHDYFMYTICPKGCGHLTFIPICGSSTKFCHKVKSTQLSRMSLYAVALHVPFTGNKLFQPDCAHVHSVRSMKTWFAKTAMQELKWPSQNPDFNLTEDSCDELECQWCPRHHCLASSTRQIPTATMQNLMECLPRIVQIIIL